MTFASLYGGHKIETGDVPPFVLSRKINTLAVRRERLLDRGWRQPFMLVRPREIDGPPYTVLEKVAILLQRGFFHREAPYCETLSTYRTSEPGP